MRRLLTRLIDHARRTGFTFGYDSGHMYDDHPDMLPAHELAGHILAQVRLTHARERLMADGYTADTPTEPGHYAVAMYERDYEPVLCSVVRRHHDDALEVGIEGELWVVQALADGLTDVVWKKIN